MICFVSKSCQDIYIGPYRGRVIQVYNALLTAQVSVLNYQRQGDYYRRLLCSLFLLSVLFKLENLLGPIVVRALSCKNLATKKQGISIEFIVQTWVHPVSSTRSYCGNGASSYATILKL